MDATGVQVPAPTGERARQGHPPSRSCSGSTAGAQAADHLAHDHYDAGTRAHSLRALVAGRGSSVYRRLLLEAALVAVMAVVVFRVPSASRDVTKALARIDTARLGWLPAGIAAELLAFAAIAEGQRRLLDAGGVRMPRRTLLGITMGANAINLLVPLGALPAGGWTVARYRDRGAPTSLALWAVLAGGFSATLAVLVLAIAGAALADVASYLTLAIFGAVLIAGSVLFVAGVHRLPAIDRRLQHHVHRRGLGRVARTIHRATGAASELIGWRVGPRGGAVVIACSLGNWVAEAACLAAAFAMVGYPVPWGSLLFAFAVSQLAGSLVPLPGGLGAVEGGLVGVLTVPGPPVGHAISATILYRVLSYWGVAVVGAVILAVRARRAARASRGERRSDGRPSHGHVGGELVQPGAGSGVAGGTPVAAR
jgi:uncharacterized protein (TIRG00374 family)